MYMGVVSSFLLSLLNGCGSRACYHGVTLFWHDTCAGYPQIYIVFRLNKRIFYGRERKKKRYPEGHHLSIQPEPTSVSRYYGKN